MESTDPKTPGKSGYLQRCFFRTTSKPLTTIHLTLFRPTQKAVSREAL